MEPYELFEQHLNQIGLNMERVVDDECVFFRSHQTTENGANVVVVISFYPGKNYADIEFYNIAKLANPLKEEKYLALINELNRSYRFAKVILNQEHVQLSYSLSFDTYEALSSEIMGLTIALLNNVDEIYPKFMKLQWA